MPKILRYVPTPKKIAVAAASIKAAGIAAMRQCVPKTSKMRGAKWSSGDVAWVNHEGEWSISTLIEDPYECSTGTSMVMVRDGDGDWEVPLSNLRLDLPSGAVVSAPMSKLPAGKYKDKTRGADIVGGGGGVGRSGEVRTGDPCRCGCGETASKGRKFRPGHDSKFHSRVNKVRKSKMSYVELKRLVQPYALRFYDDEIKTSKNGYNGKG